MANENKDLIISTLKKELQKQAPDDVVKKRMLKKFPDLSDRLYKKYHSEATASILQKLFKKKNSTQNKTGGAPTGNQFWKLRAKHGRDTLFETPELLWDAACEYFDWCEQNPLTEAKAFAFQGEITVTNLNKLRAFTMSGLCLFLGCTESYFRTFKSTATESTNKDFLTVISQIEQTVYNQKFQGAAADLLNANIISRDLGLVDRTDNKHDVDAKVKSDIDLSNYTDEELEELERLIERQSKSGAGPT